MIGEQIISKASGKVLVAGGYGVLQEDNLGLTLAVDKYFYSVSSSCMSQHEEPIIVVDVSSPQIKGKWRYIFNTGKNQIQESENKSNAFVENAIKHSLIYVCKHQKPNVKSINIIVLQDRGFLSEPTETNPSLKFIEYTQESTKTGLGSSACVIVVVVWAILRQILGKVKKSTVNAVSQTANLAAQSKIGSNFDISTAVFGSHLYKNLLPKIAFQTIITHKFENLQNIDPEINHIEPSVIIEHGFSCIIDLKKGSNTRKMVSGFLKNLKQLPQPMMSDFFSTSKQYVKQIYQLLIDKNLDPIRIRKTNLQYRSFLSLFSSRTNTPVEPPEFKEFLDEICHLNSILYVICPGSGGYDAIFILSTAQSEQIKHVKQKIYELCKKHLLITDIKDVNIVWRDRQLQKDEIDQIEKYLQS